MSRSITEYSQRQKRVTLADWAMSDAGSRRLLKVEVPTGAPRDETIDLTEVEYKQALDDTNKRRAQDPDKKPANVSIGSQI